MSSSIKQLNILNLFFYREKRERAEREKLELQRQQERERLKREEMDRQKELVRKPSFDLHIILIY